MPFVLAFFGIVLIVASVRGQAKNLLAQMSDDGKHFIPWFIIVALVSSVGLSKTWRPVSNSLYTLVVIAFVLSTAKAILENLKQISSEAAK